MTMQVAGGEKEALEKVLTRGGYTFYFWRTEKGELMVNVFNCHSVSEAYHIGFMTHSEMTDKMLKELNLTNS